MNQRQYSLLDYLVKKGGKEVLKKFRSVKLANLDWRSKL